MTESERRKDEGMEAAAEARVVLLEQARGIAIGIATTRGVVTADDIPDCLREQLGPAAGSIFKGSTFRFTGNRIKSVLPRNHARELKVWELV